MRARSTTCRKRAEVSTRPLDELRTPRLILTRFRAGDLDDLDRMHCDTQVMATLGGTRSRKETARFLDELMAHWEEHRFGLWVARDPVTGEFAGRGGLRCVIVDGAHEVEVAYAVMPG